MGLQYAFPGLMTPRPVKFDTRIIAHENGSITLLLHAGKAGDIVHYCILVGGHRIIGYVKDPSYRHVKGLDWDKPSPREFTAPQLSYITETLPDNVVIPKIDVNGCPMPITELNHEECRPAYYILKLQTTGLPIGDSIIEVAINGKRRNYIVTRPDFHIHRHHSRNLGKLYNRLLTLPDGSFDLQTDNGKSTTVDVHVLDKKLPDVEYIAFMQSKNAMITLDFSWTESGWITIKVPQGIPTGFYKLVLTYSTDDENWKIVTQGNVRVKEREEDELNIEYEPGVATDVAVELEQYNVDADKTQFKAYLYTMQETGEGQGEELETRVEDGNLIVTVPALEDDEITREWCCFYSIFDGSWVAMSGGTVTVQEPYQE